MHDRSDDILAAVVRARRAALDLAQDELAELARCSTRFVHTVEAGKRTLRLDKLLDVLSVLGLGLELRHGRGVTVDPTLTNAGKAEPEAGR